MTEKQHNIVHLIMGAIIIILTILACQFFKDSRQEKIVEIPIEIKDTITVEKERIVEHTRVKYVTTFDTIIVVESDTILDSIPLELPIEHKVYADTLRTDTTEIAVEVLFSGFKPSLDEIDINYHYTGNRVLKVKKEHWRKFIGVGVYAGAGLGYSPIEKRFNVGAPEVGVGIVMGFGYTY